MHVQTKIPLKSNLPYGALVLMLALTVSSCTTTEKNETEKWNPRVFSVDPTRSALVRGQDRSVIQCSAAASRDYMCMSFRDFETMIAACLMEKKKSWYDKLLGE